MTSVILSFPAVIFNEWSETHSTCVGPWTLDMDHPTKVYVIIRTSLICIQMVAVFYCYGSLIRGLCFTDTVCPETVGERSAEKKKLVIKFILVTSGFFIGYVPIIVFYTVVSPADDKQVDDFQLFSTDFKMCVNFAFACSLCFNPILYAFRSTNFQEGFKRIILCWKQTPQNEIQLQ